MQTRLFLSLFSYMVASFLKNGKKRRRALLVGGKINHSILIEKDENVCLIEKCRRIYEIRAQKRMETLGIRSNQCVKSNIAFGYAIHYFEKNKISVIFIMKNETNMYS